MAGYDHACPFVVLAPPALTGGVARIVRENLFFGMPEVWDGDVDALRRLMIVTTVELFEVVFCVGSHIPSGPCCGRSACWWRCR